MTVFRAAAILFMLFLAMPVAASSCFYPPGSTSDHVKREFGASGNVFSATVIDVKKKNIDGVETRVAVLRINRVWKGKYVAEEHIDAIADQNFKFIGSGFEAPLNAEIIVFASAWRNMISLSGCSLTGYVSSLEDQIPLLDSLSERRGADA